MLKTPTSVGIISHIKRDKINKQARMLRVKEMRDALPILNRDEIRRIRLPYHEALQCELEEAGCVSAATFVRQLLKYQEDLRTRAGPESAFFVKPRLFECKKELDALCKGLRQAELAHYADNIGLECDLLLQLGVRFGLDSTDWWWLGEQLLIQAVHVASNYQKDGGRRSAISKFIYGKFIMENLTQPARAKEELSTARQLSMGKSWTPRKELKIKPDVKCYTIFVESCKLLFKCLLAEAREIMVHDPLKAARICEIAKRRAIDGCDRKGESEAVMTQGLCEMMAGDAFAAVRSFFKVLVYHTKMGKAEGSCEARIHLALAYLKIGRYKDTLKHLEQLLKFTTDEDMDYYRGQALKFLGEYYLNQGVPTIATTLLMKALKIFHEVGDLPNREQVRDLASVSAGQELLAKYADLILKCGKPGEIGQEYVMQLVRWKNTRELFWKKEEDEDEDKERSSSVTSEGSLPSIESSEDFLAYGEFEAEEEEGIFEDEFEVEYEVEPEHESEAEENELEAIEEETEEKEEKESEWLWTLKMVP